MRIKGHFANEETLVLCISNERVAKDRAIRGKQEERFLRDSAKLQARIEKGRLKKDVKIGEAIGRLKERYPRVARYYSLTFNGDPRTKCTERIPSHRCTGAASGCRQSHHHHRSQGTMPNPGAASPTLDLDTWFAGRRRIAVPWREADPEELGKENDGERRLERYHPDCQGVTRRYGNEAAIGNGQAPACSL